MIQKSKFIKPFRLKKGDTIGIVAPAWSFDPQNFKRGEEKLRKLGFKVKYDRAIFRKYWSMAGNDRLRAEQINCMFADKQVKAIFCAKAGYGSIRTIPYLNKKVIRSNPKIFVGYSDITILLAYLQKIARMVVFHGPVLSGEIYEGMSSLTLGFLLRAITRVCAPGIITFPKLRALRPGEATGKLVGGNMSLLVDASGTPYEIDTKDKIIFLEDVAEDLAVIDSYLMHLKLAGKFKRIKGIIFGKMIDCFDYSGKHYSIRQVLKDILCDVNVPILYGFPSGHSRKGGKREANITLPLGVSVTIDANNPRIIINESGVC